MKESGYLPQGERWKFQMFLFLPNDFSSFSATTLLGGPTDIYTNGTMYLWFISSVLLCTPIANYIYLPIFYRLQLVSANQV